MKRPDNTKRNIDILLWYAILGNYAQVGRKFGLSRAHVRQICQIERLKAKRLV